MRIHKIAFIIVFVTSCPLVAITQSKPKLTLDEFFNSVSFPSVEISPDGNAVVIATERADWVQQIFRHDLWIYHDEGKGGSLIQLTQSGHDSEPKWSPDGRWIAFLSERKPLAEKSDDSDSDSDAKDEPAQLYLISPNGGEAFPVTQGEEEVHTFSWSADSQAPALEQDPERRLQERMERCGSVSNRRARRYDFRP
jgi:dipeptidyl aminopeptidase/acylaminoacyl peptidase